MAALAVCVFMLPASAAASVPTHPHASVRAHRHAAIQENTKPRTAAHARASRPSRSAHSLQAERSSHRRDTASVGTSVHRRNIKATANRAGRNPKHRPPHTEIAAVSHPGFYPAKQAPHADQRKAPVVKAEASIAQQAQDSADVEGAAQFAEDQQVAAYAPVREETLRGQLANFLAPLFGSHESLVRQNQRDEQDGLARVRNDQDILQQVRRKTLVPLPVNAGLRVDERLPVNRRYTRPWTAKFLLDLARSHSAQFDSALQVNSAVRTVQFQKRLMRINGNAAPAAGDDASSHLMGGTVDLAKREMSPDELQWMRAWLWPLQQAGKIDVEEEFHQACFHIAVYKAYMPRMPERLLAANTHPRLHAPQALRAEN
jgi:Family of unknown function (DUF5715)